VKKQVNSTRAVVMVLKAALDHSETRVLTHLIGKADECRLLAWCNRRVQVPTYPTQQISVAWSANVGGFENGYGAPTSSMNAFMPETSA